MRSAGTQKGMKIAVIGGGLMGLWPALDLAQAGASVAVFEAADAPRGASWAAAGMLAPLGEAIEGAGASAGLPAFGVYGLECWRQRAAVFARAGLDIGWRAKGSLLLGAPDAAAGLYAEWAQKAAGLGLEAHVLDGAALHRKAPHLAKNFKAGLWVPGEASVDPRLVLSALRAMFTAAGGVYQSGCAVTRLRIRGGKVCGVMLADGTAFDADSVIVAAGYESGAIEGVPVEPLIPVKGQMLALCVPPEGVPDAVIRAEGAYIVPRSGAPGRVIVGATSAPHCADSHIDPQVSEDLRSKAIAVLPDLAKAKVLSSWSGVRPRFADGRPRIGPCHGANAPQGLYVNAGHYRNGVLQAPASAQILSALIMGAADGPFAKDFYPPAC